MTSHYYVSSGANFLIILFFSSYCDEDCIDFIGAPYLDVYTGPYINPEPPLPPEVPTKEENEPEPVQNATKSEISQVLC